MIKIKGTSSKPTNRFKSCNDCGIYKAANDDYQKTNPIFSLKYLQSDYGLGRCNNEVKQI